MKTKEYYDATGDVRGSCGHLHRTIRTAYNCARRDHQACRAIPGGNSYGDRRVNAMTKEPGDSHYTDRPLTDDELATLNGIMAEEIMS